LLDPLAALQRDQLHPRQPGQRGELAQADGAAAVLSVARVPLPDQADAESGARPEFLPPAFHALGRHSQVGDLGRNGVELDSKDAGEAHKGNLHLKRRPRFTPGVDRIDPGTGREQCLQRDGTFEQHPAAARFHVTCKAHELDCVAEALLGVQENGAAFERRPIPARFRKRAECLFLGRFVLLKAPFVFRPAALQVSVQQQEERVVQMRLGTFGVQFQGAFVTRTRFLIAAQTCERDPPIVVCLERSRGWQPV